MTKPLSARLAIVVVAAGKGIRLGGTTPKAFVDLAGRPILSHALDAIFGMQEPAQVIVVVPAAGLEETRGMVQVLAGAAAGYVTVVAGGDSRQASVGAGLAELDPAIQVVLVHDAARALAPAAVFDRVAIEVTRRGVGVVPGLALTDTIKTVDDAGLALDTIDRGRLRAVQTPQGFPREQLVAAYAAADREFTDDAALVSAAGHPVFVVDGDMLAFKITTGWDLRQAERLLAPPKPFADGIRTGIGVDVHAFDDAAELWLAGLFWPDERGLAGHSDGDAVCHALCDALLSAGGLGDIGAVFGTSDPLRENTHGESFLGESVRLVQAAGFVIESAAVQIIGNQPRLGPRRQEAQAVLSEILGAPVGISATTTDGLGFTGRGEGIAAIATATLRKAEQHSSDR